MREEKYLTGVCAHVSGVLIAQEFIMPGRASNSRLGSSAVPTNPDCGKIVLSVYPVKAKNSKCVCAPERHEYPQQLYEASQMSAAAQQ